MNEEALNKKVLFNYAFIALPLSFAGLPLYIHIPDLYSTQFGLSVGALGIALLLIRIFDAVQDPFIGYIADKASKKNILLLCIGIALLVTGMTGLLAGPPTTTIAIVWFSIFMLCATAGFSIVTILINMMGGFWKNTYQQRARISSWREGFGLCGLLLAALLPAMLQTKLEIRDSFMALLIVFIALIFIASLFFYRFVREYPHHEEEQRNASQARSIFALFQIIKGADKSFFILSFLSFTAASIPAVLVMFFIRDYLNAESFTAIFLALYFISGAAFMPVWSKLAQKYDLYHIWLYAMCATVLTFIFAVFLTPEDIFAYGAICVLSGIALGADLALPPAIIAERITKRKAKHQASQYYAALTLLPKLSMAIAAGVSFITLEFIGFKADANNSSQALTALLLLYALAPCIIKMLSATMLWQLIKQEGYQNETTKRSTAYGTTRIS